MLTLLLLLCLLLLFYLAYPVYLRYSGEPATCATSAGTGQPVSVLLFSYNGATWLEEKVRFLFDEIKALPGSELIIIDDASTDGSPALLEHFSLLPGVRVHIKDDHRGIPDSMNLGVSLARHSTLVFCDQRQTLSANMLRKITAPLQDSLTGAVSACISCTGKNSQVSLLRRHENRIKRLESRTGSLIGVYGPCYALRKECFRPIPGNIILDDLYLSLQVMKSHRVVLLEDCLITDEDFLCHYGYMRVKRYLKGLLQLMADRDLLRGLSGRHRLMFAWHKLSRLLIPLLVLVFYLALGLYSPTGKLFLAGFAGLTLLGGVALFQERYRLRAPLLNLVRVNILYMAAFADLLVSALLPQHGRPGIQTFPGPGQQNA